MIIEVNIDIVKQPVDALCHQANCFTTMGSGVAKRIREVYPEAYEVDCTTVKGDIKKLGTFSCVRTHDGKTVYNVYSQYTFGMEKRQTNYEAIYSGLSAVKSDMLVKNLKTLAIPRNMGCVLGGGDWRIVDKMIDVIFEDDAIDVYICNYNPDKK